MAEVQSSVCGLVYPNTSNSTGAGWHGTGVAEALSVHLSFDSAASMCFIEASPRPSQPVIGGSILASPILVFGSNVSSEWHSLEDFHLKRPSVCQMQGLIYHSWPEIWKHWVWPLWVTSS